MVDLKGVIFDMDGVVVDNHSYHFKAWMQFSKKYNYVLNENIYRDHFNGKTNSDLFRMMFGEVSDNEIKRLADEKEQLYRDLYFNHLTPLKGLIDFLDYIHKKKFKVSLGTSAPPENVDFVLDNLKLRKYFPVIVDGFQVDKGKPDPQVYQLCAMKMGLNPKECVVFEDSLAGLEAGERAGCYIVGVATSHQVYELKSKTDKIIHDFNDVQRLLSL